MSGPISAPPDPGRRRQALRLGLESLLGPTQVQAALTLWDEDYARSRPMALADYVALSFTAPLFTRSYMDPAR